MVCHHLAEICGEDSHHQQAEPALVLAAPAPDGHQECGHLGIEHQPGMLHMARCRQQLIGTDGTRQTEDNGGTDLRQEKNTHKQQRQQCHSCKNSGLHIFLHASKPAVAPVKFCDGLLQVLFLEVWPQHVHIHKLGIFLLEGVVIPQASQDLSSPTGIQPLYRQWKPRVPTTGQHFRELPKKERIFNF